MPWFPVLESQEGCRRKLTPLRQWQRRFGNVYFLPFTKHVAGSFQEEKTPYEIHFSSLCGSTHRSSLYSDCSWGWGTWSSAITKPEGNLRTDLAAGPSSSYNLRNQIKNQNKYALLHFLSMFVVGNWMQMHRVVHYWFRHRFKKKNSQLDKAITVLTVTHTAPLDQSTFRINY